MSKNVLLKLCQPNFINITKIIHFLNAITTPMANSFSWLMETMKSYFLFNLPLILILGLFLEFETQIFFNGILSRTALITDSLIANFPAKCSYGELNFLQ